MKPGTNVRGGNLSFNKVYYVGTHCNRNTKEYEYRFSKNRYSYSYSMYTVHARADTRARV